MAEKKPLMVDAGDLKEMPSTDSIPLANMPKGGVLPLTSSLEYPINCEDIFVDRTTGTKYRLFFNNGELDKEVVTP